MARQAIERSDTEVKTLGDRLARRIDDASGFGFNGSGANSLAVQAIRAMEAKNSLNFSISEKMVATAQG